MKTLATIISTLLLGSAVATAQPARPNDWHDHTRGDYHDRDHRRDRDRDGRWLTVAASLRNDTNREIIPIGVDAGRFEKIRLQIDRGNLFVRQVVIELGNKSTQRIRLNRFLRAGETLDLDLQGRFRTVSRVIVYTDPARNRRTTGTYSVHAARPVVRSQYGYRR